MSLWGFPVGRWLRLHRYLEQFASRESNRKQTRRHVDGQKLRGHVEERDPERHHHREAEHRRPGDPGGGGEDRVRVRGGGGGLQAGGGAAEEAAGGAAAAAGQTGEDRSGHPLMGLYSDMSTPTSCSHSQQHGGVCLFTHKSEHHILWTESDLILSLFSCCLWKFILKTGWCEVYVLTQKIQVHDLQFFTFAWRKT